MYNRLLRPAAIVATGLAFALFAVSAASATTCTTVTACVFGTNTATSAGSAFGANAGVSGSSAIGDGVDGQTMYASTSSRARSGVSGYDNSSKGTYNSGVFGYSKLGSGLHATTSTGSGVYAVATSANGVPIRAQGQTTAIQASFVDGGPGLKIVDEGLLKGPGGVGIIVNTVGDAIDVASTYGYGLTITGNAEGLGEAIQTSGTDGLDISTDNGYDADPDALYIDASGGTPILVNNRLSLDYGGNLTISGSLTQNGTPTSNTRTTSLRYVRTYQPREADATMEDVGKATVRNGRATVALDPSFGSTIDPQREYYVFLTAEGENRGLYVTAKSTRGFSIREASGGTSTLDVQYRIVAKPYDAAGYPRFAAVDLADMPYSNARTRAHATKVRARQALSRAKMVTARSSGTGSAIPQ